jgi:hypothetical protein
MSTERRPAVPFAVHVPERLMIAWYTDSTTTAPTTATNTLQRLKPLTPVEPSVACRHGPSTHRVWSSRL